MPALGALPITRIRVGARLYRIHGARHDALWFGAAPGEPPTNRFDDPASEYRVCYLGCSVEAAFAEKMLRAPPVRLLTPQVLSQLSLTQVRATQELRVVTFHGAGLVRLGATAAVTTGNDYPESRKWGRRLFEHNDRPDGILYRCRHDDDTFAIALFDRARNAVTVPAHGSSPLDQNLALISALSARYGFGLSL